MLDAAGARLLGTVDLAEAIERLDRIASVRLIVLKAGANSPLLLELLQRIGRMAELDRSEEHTSELQSLMRISYAVFCLKKKTPNTANQSHQQHRNIHLHNQYHTHNSLLSPTT